MRFVRVKEKEPDQRWFVFQLDKQEMECLLTALGYYPVLELYYQPLSRHAGVDEEKQRLLEEVTRDRRNDRKKEVHAFLSNPKYFHWDSPGHYRLTLTPLEVEWLLQVLNDIRVGCWSHLGSQELDQMTEENLDEEQCRERAIMDLCGYFQMGLLQAFKDA